ncbi:MAG: beta-ketoacyl synthase chain length factor [Propionivibrio sp.]
MPIARWGVWCADGGEAESPDIGFVEPLLRRRLSRLAKMSLRVAHDCAQDLPGLRLVFASRHGDLTRTTAMLGDLADGEPLSPTVFSLSVHNASAGLFSIVRGDTTATTAVSAARSSFGFGLLEAAAQFADDPGAPVLLVYADEPAPDVYGAEAASTGPAHALALLLASDATNDLHCSMAPGDHSDSLAPHSLTFLDSLTSGSAGAWQGEGRRWAWQIQ